MTATAIQGIGIRKAGVHHVSLRSTDLARAKLFYVERLGFPLAFETEGLFLFAAGSTLVGVRAPAEATPAEDAFDPFRVGLDHIALACDSASELRRVTDALTAAGVENTGVKTDPAFGVDYVAFKDPDGIKWELYLAAA